MAPKSNKYEPETISRTNGVVKKNDIVRYMEDVQGKMPNRNSQQLETNREMKERSVLYNMYQHGQARKRNPERNEAAFDMGDTRNLIADGLPSGVYVKNIERLQRLKARSDETDTIQIDHYHPYDDVVASRGFNDKGALSADYVEVKPHGKHIHDNGVKAQTKIDKITKKLRMFEAQDALKTAWENSKNRDSILESNSKDPLYSYYLQRYIGNKELYPVHDKHRTKDAVEVGLPDKDNPVFNYYSSKHTKTNDETAIQADLRMFHQNKPNEDDLSDYNYLVNKFSTHHREAIIKTTTPPGKISSLGLPESSITKNYSAIMNENGNRTTVLNESSDFNINKTAILVHTTADTLLFNKRNKTKTGRGTMKNKFQYKNRNKLNKNNTAANQKNKPKSRRYRTNKSTTETGLTETDFYELYDEKNTTGHTVPEYETDSNEALDEDQSDEVEATTQIKKILKKKGPVAINYAKTGIKSLTTVEDMGDNGPKNIGDLLNADSNDNGTLLSGEDYVDNADAVIFDENGDMALMNVTENGGPQPGYEEPEPNESADNQSPSVMNKYEAELTDENVSREAIAEDYETTTTIGEITEEELSQGEVFSQGEDSDDMKEIFKKNVKLYDEIKDETKVNDKSMRGHDGIKSETKVYNKSIKVYDYKGDRYIDVIDQ